MDENDWIIDEEKQDSSPIGVSEVSDQAAEDGNSASHKTSTYSFPEDYRLPFSGLLYVGKLSDSFSFMGHDFRIRTLDTKEQLEALLYVVPYQPSNGYVLSYKIATVALCIETVDDQEIYHPLSPQESDVIDKKFKVVSAWYQSVVDYVYDKYLELKEQSDNIVAEAGKA